MSRGTLYALGLGPGDPDLMTVRARNLLGECRTIFAPVRRAGGQSYALDIAWSYINLQEQEVTTLAFPGPGEGWQKNTALIVEALTTGDAAFLTEGDALFYSTFIGVLAELQSGYPEVRFEIVPGVPSPMAAAAIAARPLVDDEQRLAILPAMHVVHEIPRVLKEFDTVVLLKVAPVLDAVLDQIDAAGLAESVLHVRRAGGPSQTLIAGTDCIRSASSAIRSDYFSLLIVRKGASESGWESAERVAARV